MNKRFRSLMTRLLASAPPRLQCRIQSWRSKGSVAVGRRAADPMRPILSMGTSGHDSIVIGAGSLVTRDIPPFSQAHGSPAAVRRRFSIARQLWVPVEEFTPEDASRLPAQDSYTTQLAQAGAIHMPYIATGNDMGDL